MKQRNAYKSWSSLKKQLEELLCDALKERISYFMTSYSEVHNAYGRASIRLDGKELVHFTWNKGYEQEIEQGDVYLSSDMTYKEVEAFLLPFWNKNCTFSCGDFLNAALAFRDLSISDALSSDDFIVRTLAVLDRRCGKRTLLRLMSGGELDAWPDWARQFALIRLEAEHIPHDTKGGHSCA